MGKDSGISQLALDLDTQVFVGLQLMTISTSRKFTRTELSPEAGFFSIRDNETGHHLRSTGSTNRSFSNALIGFQREVNEHPDVD